MSRRAYLSVGFRAALAAALVLALLEVAPAFLLSRPHWLPDGIVLDGVRRVYVREDWVVPQADPSMSAYDPELTYLLRPGEHRFANREFDVTLQVNSAGLRDDEASLDQPQIIVLGDSYALGWGVEQDETFSQILERRSGLKVLNASMSSFGTARQVLLLDRLDTRALRAVVLQYFQNDFAENRAFVDGGFALDVSSGDDFAAWIREHQRHQRYRPLDNLRAFLDRSSFFPELDAASSGEVVEALLETLDHCAKLEDVPIFFVQVHPWTDRRFDVTGELQRRLAADDEFAGLAIRLVPLENVLGPHDFFRLDPHLRASGHEKVATALERALRAVQKPTVGRVIGSGAREEIHD